MYSFTYKISLGMVLIRLFLNEIILIILIKVKLEDAIKADEIFTILMGDEIGPRREFIESNAKYVKNLEI